jgi:two-component system NarL family sensor kinase
MRLLVTIYMFSWSWGVFCCLPLILQLFPTGKPLSRRWALLCWLTLGTAALGNMFVGPTPEYGASSLLVAPWWAVTEGIASVVASLIFFASVASLIVRFIHGSETVRQQVLWLLVAVILVILINVPIWFTIPTGRNLLLLLSFPLIPAAATIAILRPRLYDVRIVLSRVVVYAVLTAGVIVIYVGLVAVLDQVLRGAGGPLLAALAIALAFNPVRVRLQRLVDHAVYGTRRDPVAAVSAVGQRLAGDDLGGVADALRESLRLSYVAVERGDGSLVESGELTAATQTWPLTYDAEPVGKLIVGPRHGEHRLSRADQKGGRSPGRSVSDRAARAGAHRGSESLPRTRHRRRRGGTDQTTPRAARQSRPAPHRRSIQSRRHRPRRESRPERAESLAIELADQLRQSVEGVRQLAYGLRPAALDQLGLVGALREEGSRYGPLKVIIQAPESMPALPSPVEVAAYRIAAEALTNVVRHSDAKRASVRLTTDDGTLEMIITDDGSATAPWSLGLGLASIQTRASEVGGACEAGPTAEGGRVVAVLGDQGDASRRSRLPAQGRNQGGDPAGRHSGRRRPSDLRAGSRPAGTGPTQCDFS